MAKNTEHQLSNPKRISWLLNSLMSQHQLVTLTMGEGKNELASSSLVVSVFGDSPFFSLDANANADIHKKIVDGRPFMMKSSLEGVDVRAESIKAAGVIDDPKGLLYKVPFPTQMFYFQRRETYRASLSGLFKVSVSVQLNASSGNNKETPLVLENCSLSDISATGCLVSMSEGNGKFLADYAEPVTLHLTLPESDEAVSLPATVRHRRHIQRSGIWLVGFQFNRMPMRDLDSVERCVARLQLLARQNSLLD